MDIATFRKIVSNLPANVSVLLRGRHGIGKSEIARQIAEDVNLPLLDKRISQMMEGDLVGLQHKVERVENGVIVPYATKFLPLEWFVSAIEVPHLIFLDEMDRGSTEVSQGIFELVLDRSVQGKKIHKDCRVIAAINGGQYQSVYQVAQLDPALLDRFWVCDLNPSIEEWLEWARKEDRILPEIISFIEKNNQALEESSLKEVTDFTEVGPSRRSWERLSQTIKNWKELNSYMSEINGSENQSHPLFNSFEGLCTGFVGNEFSSLFIQYLTNKNKFFTAENVLNEYALYVDSLKELRIDEHNMILNKIRAHLEQTAVFTEDQMNNLFEYCLIIPKELVLVVYDKIGSIPTIEANTRGIFVSKIRNLVKSIVGNNKIAV